MLVQAKKISVVIPLFNKRETITQTLESVLAQTRQADEVIVIDDGSSDDSARTVDSHFGSKVRLIKQENAGVSAARNHGARVANGDYLAFLDADDLWVPHYLEEVERMAIAYPDSGLIGTRYQYIDEGEKFSNPKIRFSNHYFNENCDQPGILESYFAVAARGDLPFNASTVTIKKSLFEQLNGFPVNEPMGEDQDVWARAALVTTIAYSPKVLGFYNRGADNRACENISMRAECPFSQRLHTYALSCDDKKQAEDIIDYTAAHLRHLARKNIFSGHYRAAQKLLSDPRCSRQPGKKMWLDLTRMTLQVQRYCRELPSNSIQSFSKTNIVKNLFQGGELRL